MPFAVVKPQMAIRVASSHSLLWNIKLHYSEITQAIKIFAHDGKTRTLFWGGSISWLLMTWWYKEPGHQQAWYWPHYPDPLIKKQTITWTNIDLDLCRPLASLGWVGLWGFLWWEPSAERKDRHGVSSGWSSVWHRSNTGLSSTQYEQIPIILGVWPFWLTPFFFRSITFWRAYG